MADEPLTDEYLAKLKALWERSPWGIEGVDNATYHRFREALPLLLAEIARLRSQLPKGMNHCTIEFRHCAKGHGWLTATNWVDFACPTCRVQELEAEIERLASALPKTADELERLREIVVALRSVLDWYECDHEVDTYDELPADLQPLYDALNAAEAAKEK